MTDGLGSKRLINLPAARSVSESIHILLERQRDLGQHHLVSKEVKARRNGEGDIVWDSDELRALRSLQSSVGLWETVAV